MRDYSNKIVVASDFDAYSEWKLMNESFILLLSVVYCCLMFRYYDKMHCLGLICNLFIRELY